MVEQRTPDIQYVRDVADLDKIVFTDGLAAVQAPWRVVRHIKFKNHRRSPSPRLRRLERAIRDFGYNSSDPIIVRIGQKGRWIVVDGGHRLTALRRLSRSLWSVFFPPKVYALYFLVFETPRSWRKLKDGVHRIAVRDVDKSE